MMKKTLYILIICLLGISGGAFAQIKLLNDDREYVSGRSIADIDMDGVSDTLVFDSNTGQLFCLLSSRNFDTLSFGTIPEDWDLTHIGAYDGGFFGDIYDMRYTIHYTWDFEKATGRFRLSEYSSEHLGNAMNDGAGQMTFDLLTGEFVADWYYYDPETDDFVVFPTVRMYIDNPPVYIDGDMDIVFPTGLYEHYKEAYEPPYCDTVRFVSYTYDGGEYPTLNGRSPDGKQHYYMVGSGYRELFKGDLVQLTTEIHCYQEPGDGSFRAAMMVGDIEVIEPGRLRLFTESNKKARDYRDSSMLAETWESRRLDGIDYYIAAGNDHRVEKYLRRPGTLWIYLHDFDSGGQRDIARLSVCFLAELYNEYNGRRKEVCKIVMEMTGDGNTLYYRYDNKRGRLTPLNIE